MSHPFDYSNKRVVITGAYSGVGAALLDILTELGGPEVIALDTFNNGVRVVGKRPEHTPPPARRSVPRQSDSHHACRRRAGG